MLKFLNDLSKFSETFGAFKANEQPKQEAPSTPPPPPKQEDKSGEKENPQSPTSGIADEFIQSILDSYLKKT